MGKFSRAEEIFNAVIPEYNDRQVLMLCRDGRWETVPENRLFAVFKGMLLKGAPESDYQMLRTIMEEICSKEFVRRAEEKYGNGYNR